MKKMSMLTKTVLAIAAFTAVACGKKDGGGSSTYVPPVTGCYNGVCNNGGGGTLLPNVQFQGFGIVGGIASIDAVASNGYQMPPIQYQGQVMISGQFQLVGNVCGVPDGAYNFSTVSQANYSMGAISNIRIQASGPMTLEFEGSAVLYNPNGGLDPMSATNRINFNIYMLRVNGMPAMCGGNNQFITN